MLRHLAAAAAAAVLTANAASAMPFTARFLAEIPDLSGLAFGDLEAIVSYDPDTAVNTGSSGSRFNNGTYAIDGTLRLRGQTANVTETTFFLREDVVTGAESVTIAFIIDPPPFNDSGNSLIDDDQDDGLEILDVSGDPTSVDVNRLQISFAGGRSNPGFLDGVGLPTDLAFLNDPPGGQDLQIDVFGVANFSSLFSTLSPSADSGYSGAWSAVDAGAEIPLPAALPLMGLGLAALGVAARRRRT